LSCFSVMRLRSKIMSLPWAPLKTLSKSFKVYSYLYRVRCKMALSYMSESHFETIYE
jgi:hypothetical protein